MELMPTKSTSRCFLLGDVGSIVSWLYGPTSPCILSLNMSVKLVIPHFYFRKIVIVYYISKAVCLTYIFVMHDSIHTRAHARTHAHTHMLYIYICYIFIYVIYIYVTVNLRNQSFRVMTDMFRHFTK